MPFSGILTAKVQTFGSLSTFVTVQYLHTYRNLPSELPFGCMASYEQKSIPDRCADGIFPSSQGFLTVSAATAQTC